MPKGKGIRFLREFKNPSFNEMKKSLVVGLGTGRCGTRSLRNLLNNELGFYAVHEMNPLPWRPIIERETFVNIAELNRQTEAFKVADIGWYYLNYVQAILKELPDTKFICLWRKTEEVIDSFLKKTPSPNWWTHPASKYWDDGFRRITHTDLCFPKYDLPKGEAIRAYCEEYQMIATIHSKKFSNFLLIEMNEALNTDEGKQRIFNFIENGAKS